MPHLWIYELYHANPRAGNSGVRAQVGKSNASSKGRGRPRRPVQSSEADRFHKHRFWGLWICACPCFNGIDGINVDNSWYDGAVSAKVSAMVAANPSLRKEFTERVLIGHDWKYWKAFVEQLKEGQRLPFWSLFPGFFVVDSRHSIPLPFIPLPSSPTHFFVNFRVRVPCAAKPGGTFGLPGS